MNIIEKTTEFCRDFEFTAPHLTSDDLIRDAILSKTIDFLYEELAETELAVNEENRPEIIDGFGDIAFVALNGIYKEFRTIGDNHVTAMTKTYEVMLRICEANLSVQKPEGWQQPNYDDLL